MFEAAQAELAGPHTPDLLGGDEPRLLQDAYMLLHAREGHVEQGGKGRDGSVGTPELLQNAAPGGVGERAERGIEGGLVILNHLVQYIASNGETQGLKGRNVTQSGPCVARRFTFPVATVRFVVSFRLVRWG